MNQERIEAIGDRLVAGTDEISEVLRPDEKLTDELSAAIHERLGRCALCTVWEEKPNLNDSNLCPDCEALPPPRVVDHARVSECAEELIGTCKSLESVLTEEERENTAFLSALDQEVMLCSECEWWCESSELNEDDVCEDCAD